MTVANRSIENNQLVPALQLCGTALRWKHMKKGLENTRYSRIAGVTGGYRQCRITYILLHSLQDEFA